MRDDTTDVDNEALELSPEDQEVERRTTKTAQTMAGLTIAHLIGLVANSGILNTSLIVTGVFIFMLMPLGAARAVKSIGTMAKHAKTQWLIISAWGSAVITIAVLAMPDS